MLSMSLRSTFSSCSLPSLPSLVSTYYYLAKYLFLPIRFSFFTFEKSILPNSSLDFLNLSMSNPFRLLFFLWVRFLNLDFLSLFFFVFLLGLLGISFLLFGFSWEAGWFTALLLMFSLLFWLSV